MADAAEIQKFFTDFSKDVLAKIDTIHMQLADVNARLTAIETGRSAKDMAAELEREELLALKLEMTTKEAMEKAGRDFLKAQTKNFITQATTEITARLEAKLFYKDEPKPEIPSGGAVPAAPDAFLALEI
jgi:beta-xylosidase